MTRVALVPLLALVGACGVQHIRGHTPRHRNYDPGRFEKAPKQLSEGSLWQDASRGLVADFRAGRIGDLVTIRVDESPEAAGDAATEMNREASIGMGATKLLGFAEALQESNPDLDTSQLIELMSKAGFEGNGETTRGSRVRGMISARVRKTLPNGDLYIEGTKVLMVNDEELHIYVSGVVRPEDIEQDNSVRSSLVADAQIEFTGRGALTDNQRQGWLSSILSAINPF